MYQHIQRLQRSTATLATGYSSNTSILTPSALHRRIQASVRSINNVDTARNTGIRNIPESNEGTQRTFRRRSEHIPEKQSRHGHTRRLDFGLSVTKVGSIAQDSRQTRMESAPWSPRRNMRYWQGYREWRRYPIPGVRRS